MAVTVLLWPQSLWKTVVIVSGDVQTCGLLYCQGVVLLTTAAVLCPGVEPQGRSVRLGGLLAGTVLHVGMYVVAKGADVISSCCCLQRLRLLGLWGDKPERHSGPGCWVE